jgi:uncharacterized phage protein gp47/JayE
MAALTLQQLLNPQTPQEVFNALISLATNLGFPTSSWQAGGVERARLLLFATMLSDLSSNYQPSVVQAGLLASSSGDWLTLFALNNYLIQRNPATPTDGYLSFNTASSGAGPYVVSAQTMFAIFPDGLRYYNTDDFTIPASSTISLVHFRSQFPVNTVNGFTYNEGNNQAITLLNPLPGVLVSNPELSFSAVIHTGVNSSGLGIGTGTIVPSGTPLNKYYIIVRIDKSGESGVTSWSYSVDGNEYVSVGVVASAEIFDGATDTGVLVTLANGSPVPSFIQGDNYIFSTPESWIFAQGADEESDVSVIQRCEAQFPDLSALPEPTNSFYIKLAKETPGVGSQVTQVIVQPDGYINGKLNVIIAGPAGQLTATTTEAVQNYIQPRVFDFVSVNSPGALNVGVAFTITVSINSYTTLYGTTGFDGTVGAVLNTYIDTVPINGVVDLSQIVRKVLELDGTIDITLSTVKLNGVAANITLGSPTSFQLANFDSATSSITWVRE